MRRVCRGQRGEQVNVCSQLSAKEPSAAERRAPFLGWSGRRRGGGRLGARRDEEWAGEQRPGEDSGAPVRQVITRQVNETVCMYVLEIESSSSPVE